MWLTCLIIISLIVFFLWLEYRCHDCINGKKCLHSAPLPTDTDSIPQRLDKLSAMVKVNYAFIQLNQAALIGLIMALPVGYFLVKRIPSLFEWLIMAIIIALGVYFSYSWIYVHFLCPNGQQIESNLLKIRDLYVASTAQPKRSTAVKRTKKTSRN